MNAARLNPSCIVVEQHQQQNRKIDSTIIFLMLLRLLRLLFLSIVVKAVKAVVSSFYSLVLSCLGIYRGHAGGIPVDSVGDQQARPA